MGPPVASCAAAAACPGGTARRLWPAAVALLLALAATSWRPAHAAPAAPAAAAADPGKALDISKRSVPAAPADFGGSDYPDYQSSGRFDEYPVVVPKRTAMLLDRMMTELQRATGGNAGPSSSKAPAEDIPDTMGLQRRGQQKGSRVYWRCYFNAVTCFRRK